MFKPINPVAFNIFGKDVYWYGITMALAVIVAIFVAIRMTKKRGHTADNILDCALYTVPLGVIGARLYYVAFEWANYASDPIRILYVWEGGLALYGAVIGGLIGIMIYCRVKKVKLGDMVDYVAPGLVLAQAIGRWGNYFNQEAFGPVVTDPIIQKFPFACVYIEKSHTINVNGVVSNCYAPYHLATFFYESVWNLIVFAILLIYWRKERPRGNIFFLYITLYGLGRAIIEGLRADSLYLLPGIRISQVLSILLVLGGWIAILINNRRHGSAVLLGPAAIERKKKRKKGEDEDEEDIDEAVEFVESGETAETGADVDEAESVKAEEAGTESGSSDGEKAGEGNKPEREKEPSPEEEKDEE